MNRIARIVLIVIAALLVALLAGYLWGSSGRADLRARLSDTQLRLDLAQAASNAVRARVDIFEVNFGQASRHLETAKRAAEEMAARLDEAGHKDQGDRARQAVADITQAQTLAAKLDQTSNARAAQAVAMLDGLAGALADTTTVSRAASVGLAPGDYLARNDSYAFFTAIGDLVRTGPTTTNVGDVQILLIGKSRRRAS